MSSRKARDSDPIDLARCKRIVRPLQSKIHQLNELITSFPSKTNLQYETPHKSFLHPKTSTQRLASLKPYIDPDLYQSYLDIFQIFQGVVRNVVVKRPNRVPRLSMLCCVNLGKSITLSTRSTYYKLNQSSLFDPETLPGHLHRIYHSLHETIDPWLELEPVQLYGGYRRDMLMGYIIHLIVFNLGMLYMLVPVLVQWLQEELRGHSNGPLMAFSTILFNQYWHFDETYHPDFDGDFLSYLDANKKIDNNGTFWILYRMGYWQAFINDMELMSKVGHYDSLMIEALARPLRVPNANTSLVIKALIHITACPFHPSINLALCNILRNLIVEVRSKSNAVVQYQHIIQFMKVWLSFPPDPTQVVFNSLLPGNEFLFRCLTSVTKYLAAVVDAKDTKLRNKVNHCLTTIGIFQHFYLDIGDNEDTTGFIECFFEMHKSSKEPNESFNEFVMWLHDQGTSEYIDLSRHLFSRFYTDENDPMLDATYGYIF